MKKLFTLLAVMSLMIAIPAYSQNEGSSTEGMDAQTTEVQQETPAERPGVDVQDKKEGEQSIHMVIKTKFIEGGAGFMAIVVLCLIFGLAICIERILYLSMASINTKSLLSKVEEALDNGGVEEAKEVCRNTRGPIASIFYQGLDRAHESIDVVEKAVLSYGSVQMGLLERGMTWIQLFIAIAPMLGFMGTVIGMIDAFDQIQLAGDISATVVAGGIKVALITTVTGLIVAIILQIFYNYIVSKIDNIVHQMEDSSISLVDLIVRHQLKK